MTVVAAVVHKRPCKIQVSVFLQSTWRRIWTLRAAWKWNQVHLLNYSAVRKIDLKNLFQISLKKVFSTHKTFRQSIEWCILWHPLEERENGNNVSSKICQKNDFYHLERQTRGWESRAHLWVHPEFQEYGSCLGCGTLDRTSSEQEDRKPCRNAALTGIHLKADLWTGVVPKHSWNCQSKNFHWWAEAGRFPNKRPDSFLLFRIFFETDFLNTAKLQREHRCITWRFYDREQWH